MTVDAPLTIAIMYPEVWEARPRAELDDDIAALKAIDPRIRVLETRYVDPDDLRVRRGSDPNADLRGEAPELTDEQRAALAEVEIVIAQDLPFDIGTVAPKLRFVQAMGAGVSQLVSAGLADAGVRLTTAAGNNAVSISEFVMGRILEHWKRLQEINANQAEQQWLPAFGRELAGRTIAIVGLGSIGTEIARRLQAFGVTVLASRASYVPGMTHELVDEMFGPEDLHQMLSRSDAVVSAVPETPATIDVMGAPEFAAMPPGSFYCNVGRGSFVVEADLIAALESGHLGAAAIDVVREEPLPSHSALWTTTNLALSPHCASSADRFFANLHTLFRKNVRHYIAGEPLINEVDAARGY